MCAPSTPVTSRASPFGPSTLVRPPSGAHRQAVAGSMHASFAAVLSTLVHTCMHACMHICALTKTTCKLAVSVPRRPMCGACLNDRRCASPQLHRHKYWTLAGDRYQVMLLHRTTASLSRARTRAREHSVVHTPTDTVQVALVEQSCTVGKPTFQTLGAVSTFNTCTAVECSGDLLSSRCRLTCTHACALTSPPLWESVNSNTHPTS